MQGFEIQASYRLGESGSRLVYEYASTSHFPSDSFIHSLSLFHPIPFPTKYQHEQLRRNISEEDFLAEELKRTLMYNALVVPFGLGPYFMNTEEDKEMWENIVAIIIVPGLTRFKYPQSVRLEERLFLRILHAARLRALLEAMGRAGESVSKYLWWQYTRSSI